MRTSTEAPYQRIAAELRRRIDEGELRPGDRVPSARAITEQWGVAIATATKAHAVLREAGLTVARPGVGTVVAGSAPHRSGPVVGGPASRGAGSVVGGSASRGAGSVVGGSASHRAGSGVGGTAPHRDTELTKDRIVAAAVTIADRDGLAELAMRRIAGALGVATMSLYRHVPSREELLREMIDRAIGDIRLPARHPGDWRAALELCARVEWVCFQRHPWLAPTMSLTRPQLAPNAMRLSEWVLTALDGTRLTLSERMYVQILLFSFVRGVASALEPEAEAIRETGLTNDEWMATQARLFGSVATDMTHFRELAATDFDFSLDHLFEFGLARLLDGLTRFVDGPTPR